MELPIGLIAHGKIQPGLFVHNALGVGESEKTGFSVVGPHAAFTETAKPHFAGGQMDDCVVDAAAAETAMGGHKAGGLFVTGEKPDCPPGCLPLHGSPSVYLPPRSLP